MTKALPYRFVSELDKKAVAGKLKVLLAAWGQNWFQPWWDTDLTWLELEKTPHSNEKWLIFSATQEMWMAWKLDGVVTRDLLGLMFNAPVGSSVKPTPLMQDILKECAASLANEMSQSTEVILTEQEHTSFSSLRIGQGSGYLLAELGGKFPRQVFALGGGLVEHFINRTPTPASLTSLVSRETVIGKYTTNLEVSVGKAELTLRDLTLLEVGDVIRLETSVKEPFVVRTTEGVPVAKAHLGTYDNNKAIQLIED